MRGGLGAGEDVENVGTAFDVGGDGVGKAAVGGGVAGVVGRWDEVARTPNEGGHFDGGNLNGGGGTGGVFEHVGQAARLALVLIERARAG